MQKYLRHRKLLMRGISPMWVVLWTLTAAAVRMWRVLDHGRTHRQPLTTVRVVARSLSSGLLLMLCMSPASAACLHWERLMDRPDESAVYAGVLGDHRIRMMLHLDVATGHLRGAYGYNNQPGTLELNGYMRTDGTGVDLVERNAHGQVTGYFDLAFFEPSRSPLDGEDEWSFFEKNIRRFSPKCDFLTGIWRPVPEAGRFPKAVKLQFSGTGMDPKNRQARFRNETTAYAFMQAMLHHDRKKVVSLLNYPFHSYNYALGREGVRTWKTPASVLKNYAEIMQFENKYLRWEVPHILFTDDGLTDFMNGSIYIYNGKITWICAGSCPHLPYSVLAGKD